MKTSYLLDKYAFRLQTRDELASKGDYGKLLVIAGSCGMAGAAFLSGFAAFRSGIGMVRFYGPEENRVILQSLLPEAMYDSESPGKLIKALSWADYVICGPGLGTDDSAKEKVKSLFHTDLSEKKLVLLDADALNIISSEKFDVKELSIERSRKKKDSNIVLTPHVGEMSRLTGLPVGIIKEQAAAVAGNYAAEHHCTVILKDSVSFVAVPYGPVYLNDSGCSALAKAGSGDVLTGIVAGVTAVIGGIAEDGAVLGDYFHGKAGELAALYQGEHSLLARDVADAVAGLLGKESLKYDEAFERCLESFEEDTRKE